METIGYIAVVVVLFFILVSVLHTGILPLNPSYGTQTLNVTDCDGNTVASLDVDVADSFSSKYVGLSGREKVQGGLLLEYSSEGSRTVVMRQMNVSLDVIFISSEGTISSIEQADAPQGVLEYYVTYESVSGPGQYVLEVPQGWASENGITEGFCVEELR